MIDEPNTSASKETSRIEAFSDGVIAIAITLLILEIKIPKAAELGSDRLLFKLLQLWPGLLAFMMSFGMILVMWVNHHRIFRLVRTTDYPFLYWNGFLLLTITFVPFPTAVLAEHLKGAEAVTAASFYAGTMIVIAIAYDGLWFHLRRHPQLLLLSADRAEIEAITSQYRFGPAYYLGALVLAQFSVAACLGTCASLAIYFAFASRPRLCRSGGIPETEDSWGGPNQSDRQGTS